MVVATKLSKPFHMAQCCQIVTDGRPELLQLCGSSLSQSPNGADHIRLEQIPGGIGRYLARVRALMIDMDPLHQLIR